MMRRGVLITASLIVAFAGLVDAVVGEVWDLVAVLSAIAVLLAWHLLVTARRHVVALRPDLAHWIHERAVAEGEPAETIASRAVATYRMHLLGSDSTTTGSATPDAAT